MYRRDLITAEIQKLAQVLARIMGLKLEGKLAEADRLFEETMESGFQLPKEILENKDLSVFENWLVASNLPPEKLDSLSEFLYYELGISQERNQTVAPKLNFVYQYLSDEHKIVHLVNLHRQKTIQQYLR
ncbi:hypothetical protein SAMN04488511_11710 [Pedobacter suwonensis]|uniref:Uncharacterized protein n=1 Tax=Pedobacter suwonensis TaxID=332999 RepID=A0A1I0TYV1_9SPHI|nr:hypothetical protein [Pedobacter suwonensis]SFA57041.1 hypothetical protein SAMN04488511_11710 [Pedobacter suwonensis]